jgi:hypothetical protein
MSAPDDIRHARISASTLVPAQCDRTDLDQCLDAPARVGRLAARQTRRSLLRSDILREPDAQAGDHRDNLADSLKHLSSPGRASAAEARAPESPEVQWVAILRVLGLVAGLLLAWIAIHVT